MEIKKRTKIMCKMSTSNLKAMIKDIDYEIVKPVTKSTVMCKVREKGKNSLFYLGELVVYECFVKVDGVVGKGICDTSGNHSLFMAVVDAIYKSNNELKHNFSEKLSAEEVIQIEQLNNELIKISNTKVDFSTMQEEI